MDQSVLVSSHAGYDAMGPYWTIGWTNLKRGKLSFLVDQVGISLESPIVGIAMPPNSVVSYHLEDIISFNSALFSRAPAPDWFPRSAIAFSISKTHPLSSLEDAADFWGLARDQLEIGRSPKASRGSCLVKDFIGEHFSEDLDLAGLAKLHGSSVSYLNRIFKRDWGKPPVQYKNHLRILDSFRLICQENAITDVAFDVGFNDLSRFHKNFKGIIGRSPYSIHLGSKNAKIF